MSWPTYDMGEPLVPIERAVHFLDDLDAGALAREMYDAET